MLEDRIIVQDRGIDAGLAALIQNANKGNMDPAALMAMMNNGGFGGNGGWWWIWIILIFFCWGGFGGNGFGRGGNDAGRLASQLNTDANTSLLMQAINGNKEAISSLSNTLNAWKAGDIEKARELQNFSQDVINVICHYRGNIVAGKRIMKLIGLDLGKNRTPFQNMTDEEEARMKAELEAINFFDRCNKF